MGRSNPKNFAAASISFAPIARKRRLMNVKIRVVPSPDPAEDNHGMNELGLSLHQEASCEVCPLSCVRIGVAVRIRKLCAAPEMQERLREIGLCEDQVIKLITNRTNFICQVCNSRLALSQQLAQLIMVEPVLQPASTPAG
jgi:Fe2+ transport system protein FeoA